MPEHHKKKRPVPLHRLIFYTSLLLGCVLMASASAEELKKISFIPQWVPQAQFAGYYVAYEKGFYTQNGIDLTIIEGGPTSNSGEFIKAGKADVASLWLSSAISLSSEGVPLVNIAQVIQRSALMLVAKKKSGIFKPEDMNHKKVGLWDSFFQIQPHAFFKKYHLDVKEIRQSYSVNLFLRDGVDVASAMWYNEYHTLLNSGMDAEELTTFFFHDHDLNFPEDGIYVREAFFRKDPDVCRAFVNASLQGWKAAFLHPEEALDIVMRNLEEAHVPATRVHQRWMLNRMKDLMTLGENGMLVTTLKEEDFNRVVQVLKDSGLITTMPDYSSFYRE